VALALVRGAGLGAVLVIGATAAWGCRSDGSDVGRVSRGLDAGAEAVAFVLDRRGDAG
jgi:hypothetical protein